MKISRIDFPEILLDNDATYIQYLTGIIESVDELSSMEIRRSPTSWHFRIAPSMPKYTNLLLQEILRLHTLFKIRLDLSKSIKTTSTIFYSINTD